MKKVPGVKNISTTMQHDKQLSRKIVRPFFGVVLLKNKKIKILFSNLKIPIIKKRVPFCLKVIFFVMFGGCPSFLNKVLDKVHSKRLRSYDPANRTKVGRP